MGDAEGLATRLAYDFLRSGQYSASVGPVELAPPAFAATVNAGVDQFGGFDDARSQFSGLSVQSVGFEEGPEEPKVHIYVTKGSSRYLKSLPQDIDGVPVQVHKMGPVTVRPDTAGSSTNRGNIFERNNRICCGSSCGPTSEQCAGTIGALVRVGAKASHGVLV